MLKPSYKYTNVLSIAGFDGGGGAGIQGDQKTIAALGCYATTVLTALPIQSTGGVKSIYAIPAKVVRQQLETVIEDIRPDAIKIGMLHTPEIARVISMVLKHYSGIPMVLDPVMVSSSGHQLAGEPTVRSMIENLFPLAMLVTPNIDEASLLSGMEICGVEDMQEAAGIIQKLGCPAVLLKGGHLTATQLTSVLCLKDGSVHHFKTEKIDSNNLHGTGCALSSAIASFLAIGKSLPSAITLGQKYVHQAIVEGQCVITGKGKGPLNHFFAPQKLKKRRI